ncbi:MAG: hypothetical protein HC924_17835 [Synechococcaceae cyanobacterium SM2_3_2]|nr:hypothetical protein [Synechococcaceae cyanobacterium SM2_3_2]
MTDDERFDRLATAIEQMADSQIATNQRVDQLTQAHLGLVSQVGLLADITRGLAERQAETQQQQAEIRQRQIEQDQRFDVLLGEIRHIVQRLDEGSR